jgi:hypothetical protein
VEVADILSYHDLVSEETATLQKWMTFVSEKDVGFVATYYGDTVVEGAVGVVAEPPSEPPPTSGTIAPTIALGIASTPRIGLGKLSW